MTEPTPPTTADLVAILIKAIGDRRVRPEDGELGIAAMPSNEDRDALPLNTPDEVFWPAFHALQPKRLEAFVPGDYPMQASDPSCGTSLYKFPRVPLATLYVEVRGPLVDWVQANPYECGVFPLWWSLPKRGAVVYEFQRAPLLLRILADCGGDEDWIVAVRDDARFCDPWLPSWVEAMDATRDPTRLEYRVSPPDCEDDDRLVIYVGTHA